jgi:uncharacterized protein
MSRRVLEYVVPWLIDHPEDVKIADVEGERQGDLILELSVHPDDMGKVIGKRGRIIHALRSLARAAGQREGKNITVEVVD